MHAQWNDIALQGALLQYRQHAPLASSPKPHLLHHALLAALPGSRRALALLPRQLAVCIVVVVPAKPAIVVIIVCREQQRTSLTDRWAGTG